MLCGKLILIARVSHPAMGGGIIGFILALVIGIILSGDLGIIGLLITGQLIEHVLKRVCMFASLLSRSGVLADSSGR